MTTSKYVKYVKRDVEQKWPVLFCLSIGIAAMIFASGCGKVAVKGSGGGASIGTSEVASESVSLPPVESPVGSNDSLSGGTGNLVVKSRAMMNLATEQDTALSKFFQKLWMPSAYAASVSQTIVVTNAAKVTMTLDNSQFAVPTLSNVLMEFGTLAISSLSDNNLRVCGTGGKTKCGTAMIRMYTTGPAGAGLWNSEDQYGAPLYSGLQNTTTSTIGLNSVGSVTLQSNSIAAGDNVFTQTDFAIVPRYQVQGDFSNAGAGSYSTQLVIEYVLSL